MLAKFNIKDAELVSMPLANHFKLSKRLCLVTDEEKGTYGAYSIILSNWESYYALVCIRLNISSCSGSS